jgi:hydroxylamine reductase
MDMFCYQCEQAAKGVSCSRFGTCGKDPEVAALQDLLVRAAEGISIAAHRARKLGARDREVDVFVVEALFSTVTNVNFDPARFEQLLGRAAVVLERARGMYEAACRKAGKQAEALPGPARWRPAPDREGLLAQGREAGIDARIRRLGADAAGLRELSLYGLKGAAAYADHAMILGKEDEAVYAFFHEALDVLAREDAKTDQLLALALRVGEVNLRVMELLDAANTGAYGHPAPQRVRVEPLKGKAIVVSGHDLRDLDELLRQTAGTGIRVYTHGEMLPAHGYPGLRRHAHLAGNYGGAWQDQQKEFEAFPGAILMTTNCIQRPGDAYIGRIFTSGLVGWPGVTHVAGRDFSPVIRAALAAPGFAADGPERFITVGFGHNAVVGLADRIVAAVRDGAIRRFFLIGGCDGAKSGRNYYTELACAVPKDCVILTLACGKYRFNKLDFGEIGGIPRLLDVGQCNDAYSAVRIAGALATAFGTDVNGLPLSIILSWYEQKAVCVLLTLLHLGVRGIRLGPSLPAFVTPAALKILADRFGLAPVSTAAADLKAILG